MSRLAHHLPGDGLSNEERLTASVEQQALAALRPAFLWPRDAAVRSFRVLFADRKFGMYRIQVCVSSLSADFLERVRKLLPVVRIDEREYSLEMRFVTNETPLEETPADIA